MSSLLLIQSDLTSVGVCDPSLIGPDSALWLIYDWDQSDSDKQDSGMWVSCHCLSNIIVISACAAYQSTGVGVLFNMLHLK